MGQVAGTVYNAWSGEPLTATVELQGVFDMLARPDFNIWAVEGTYTLMAYASGYVTATQTVEIVAGQVTEQGLYMEPALPRLEIAAEAIDAQVVQGLVGEQTYVISNTGAVPLDFSLHEISPTLSLSRQQPASLSGKRILYDSYHGAWWIGNYSQLIEDLTEAGAEVVENYSEINESILENFDVLWVSCCGNTWSYSELQAVDEWLSQGGAVLVESENAGIFLGKRSSHKNSQNR